MKAKTVKAIAALSVIAFLASASPAAPPMAKKVPAGAMVYIGWAGRSLAFNGSMFGQMLDEPGVKDLFGAIKTAATTAITGAKKPDESDERVMFESLWAMAAIAWDKPIAGALFDIKMPPKRPAGGPAGGPREPMPHAAVIIDLAKDRAAFAGHFQKLLTVGGDKVKLSQVTVGNLSYHTFTTPIGPFSMGFSGNIFFISLGDGVQTKIAASVNGKGKSLAGEAKFTAAMKEVCGKNVQMAYYVDLPRLLAVAEKLTSTQPAREPAEQSMFRRFVKAMGIDGVTAIAGASNIVDRGYYEKCRIYSPAPHRGLLMLGAGKPLAADALAGIPADADFVAAFNLDPSRALAEVKRIAASIDPNAGKQVESMLAQAGKTIGLDIEKDILAHVGDQWTLVSAPSLGGTITGTAIIVQLKDAAKFSASLAKFESQFRNIIMGERADDPNMPPERRASRRDGRGPAIRKYKSGEIEIHYVSVSGSDEMPVAPAWAVHKGKLYLAAFPQVIAALAGGVKEKPLTQSGTFAAFRKRVSPNASGLSYVNTPSIVRRLYGAVLAGGTIATNALGRFAPSIRPEHLPPLPKVEKYVWPDISAVSSDAKGITIESYGSMPGGGLSSLFSPFQQGLAAGVLMPSLARAKSQAKKVKSMTNLHAIGRANFIYASDNDDSFPPDLVKLVECHYIPAEVLMSPNSGRRVRKDAKGKPIGPFDYVYLGGGFTKISRLKLPPAQVLIAYERPELNRNRGTNVLFADAHVEWCSMARFHRLLAQTKKLLREQSRNL